MLIKPVNYITDYVLPVDISTKKGYIRKLRYYENEKILYKAYYQLKHMKSSYIKPLYPVIYDSNCEVENENSY